MNRLPPWLAFAVPLSLYAATLPPGVLSWDPGEMQTVPYILGIAHPTAFPAFVLAAWLYVHLFALGSVAWRMSLFGALTMAAAARAAYALGRTLELGPWTALGSALVFAVGFVAWSRGTRPEVHALALAFVGTSLVCALRFRERGAFSAGACSALAYGAALATHAATLLALPGLALLVVGKGRRLRMRAALCYAGLFALPLFCYAYLPLRSAYVTALRLDPTLSLGIPPGRPFWDYGHPATPSGFLRLVTAADFHPAGFAGALAGPGALHALGTIVAPAFLREFGAIGLVLGAVGAIALARQRRGEVVGLTLATVLPGLLAIAFTAEVDPQRYLLPALWVLAVFSAAGAQALFGRWSALSLALLACLLTFNSRSIVQQRTDTGWPDYVDRVRAATPDGAVIVGEWALATPLAYAAYVERSFGGRVVETAFPEDDVTRIAAWVRERPVFVVGSASLRLAHLRLDVVDAGVPAIMRVEDAGPPSGRRPVSSRVCGPRLAAGTERERRSRAPLRSGTARRSWDCWRQSRSAASLIRPTSCSERPACSLPGSSSHSARRLPGRWLQAPCSASIGQAQDRAPASARPKGSECGREPSSFSGSWHTTSCRSGRRATARSTVLSRAPRRTRSSRTGVAAGRRRAPAGCRWDTSSPSQPARLRS